MVLLNGALTIRKRKKAWEKTRLFAVPKRGLEPPLPLREPGPEPGGSAKTSSITDTDLALQIDKEQAVTAFCRPYSHCTDVVVAFPVCAEKLQKKLSDRTLTLSSCRYLQ